MTKYFTLEPEVAGGWGETTIADRTVHPPVVSRLHYEFDVWLGDDLLATFPSYIVSEQLHEALLLSKMTGFSFDDVTVTTSDLFTDIQEPSGTKVGLPKFYWLKVHGKAGEQDFGILNTLRPVEQGHQRSKRRTTAPAYTGKYQLAVSERALNLLREFNLEHCVVDHFSD